jgi:hypothetical protein
MKETHMELGIDIESARNEEGDGRDEQIARCFMDFESDCGLSCRWIESGNELKEEFPEIFVRCSK